MKASEIRKHMLTGISYMIPMVVAGGILGAIAKGFGGYLIGGAAPEAGGTIFSNLNMFDWQQFWWAISKLSDYAMSFATATLAAGIAYSIADRPGIVPGFILGYTANIAKAGFLGGMLMAFLVGYFIKWMTTWKMHKALKSLMPVLIIPLFATLAGGLFFFIVLARPMSIMMTAFQGWIMSLNAGSQFVIGATIGACMGFDMGGPVNKTASMAANALFADGFAAPESAKIIGGMTPPLGIGISTLIAKNKFTAAERDAGLTCIPMGLVFITEGVLPFAAADPIRVIPCSMIGSAVAGGMAMALGCSTPAVHGGIFIVPITEKPLMFLLSLAVGTLVTAVLYAILRKPIKQEDLEEEIKELDITIQ